MIVVEGFFRVLFGRNMVYIDRILCNKCSFEIEKCEYEFLNNFILNLLSRFYLRSRYKYR